MNKLDNLREKIDEIDEQITNLMFQRFKISKEIGLVKKHNKKNILDEAREKEVLRSRKKQINNNYANHLEKAFKCLMDISKDIQESKHLGLLGKTLTHSKSDVVHGIIAKSIDEKIDYEYLEINENELESMIQKLRKGEYFGFTVTVPYKEKVMKYLDQLTPRAKLINAVNTIYVKDAQIYGDNTDYDGFLATLRLSKIELKDQRFIILGTGGAAKAAYQVLKDLKLDVVVVSRNKHIIFEFDKVISYDELSPSDYDIIVNATPVGMYPNIDATPLDKTLVEGKTVIDLIYNPKETVLMKNAKSSINGEDMLIVQAIYAQMRFFDKKIKISKDLVQKIKGEINNV